ncbi:MAG: hypothetical protein NT096_09275 [Proteobacteria bacterium]|nr:hypothetical protein [Pseudomonadota bacterium]
MPGIANLTITEFRALVERFDEKYVNHWNTWIQACEAQENIPRVFGCILRSWQAFRPNIMRRPQAEAGHEPPYLEAIINGVTPSIQVLENFDISTNKPFCDQSINALTGLWNSLLQLSFEGRKRTKRNGLAGAVGISKAVLLLTKGRVGPAFDSKVRKSLGISEPESPAEWISALGLANRDIIAFQEANQCTLRQAAPEHFSHIHAGRIYDMALGPGLKGITKRLQRIADSAR